MLSQRLFIAVLIGLASAAAMSPKVAAALDYVGQLAADLEPTRTVVYKRTGDRELRLHIFEPDGFRTTDRRAAFLSFHGGGWGGFGPRRHYPFAAHFARLGLVGIAVEYRLAKPGSATTIFDCAKDARSAMRYVREHASDLGLDPDRIVAHGNSAGGHLAAGTALFDGVDEAGEDLSISSRPDALVLYVPVIDTSPAGYGSTRIGERWQELSPLHRVRPGLPPTIIFHGTDDTVTPLAGARAFCDAMLQAGNRCELVPIEAAAHGDLMRDRTSFDLALRQTGAFLESAGFLGQAALPAIGVMEGHPLWHKVRAINMPLRGAPVGGLVNRAGMTASKSKSDRGCGRSREQCA